MNRRNLIVKITDRLQKTVSDFPSTLTGERVCRKTEQPGQVNFPRKGSMMLRARVHKTVKVLNATPTSVQARNRGHLHDIWQAESKTEADFACDFFNGTYGVKCDKAAAKLVRDRDALPTFYDHRAERAEVPANTSKRQT